jgi:hypothetical protein
MQTAMAQYGLFGINWGQKPLCWYEECSYTDAGSAKQHTIHIGDYISFEPDGYARVKHIYTHCLQFDDIWYIIIYIQMLKRASYMDKVLGLDVYHQVQTDSIISLSQVHPDSVYIIPLSWSLNGTTSESL